VPKAFQNRQIQISLSYWTSDFFKLHRELLKAGKRPSRRFLKSGKYNSFFKADSTDHFLKPASGNLTGFEKFLANSKAVGAKRRQN
jgi:hypothetical protein